MGGVYVHSDESDVIVGHFLELFYDPKGNIVIRVETDKKIEFQSLMEDCDSEINLTHLFWGMMVDLMSPKGSLHVINGKDYDLSGFSIPDNSEFVITDRIITDFNKGKVSCLIQQLFWYDDKEYGDPIEQLVENGFIVFLLLKKKKNEK